MTGFVRICALSALALAAGCSTDQPFGKGGDIASAALGRPTAEQAQAQVAALSAIPGLGTARRINSSVVSGTFKAVAQSGQRTQYMHPARISIVMNGDVLSGTSGMGEDVFGIEQPAFTYEDTQSFQRVSRSLNGVNERETITHDCQARMGEPAEITIRDAAITVLPLLQRCANAPTQFTNIYWLDPKTKSAIRSRQWVSPSIGYVFIE